MSRLACFLLLAILAHAALAQQGYGAPARRPGATTRRPAAPTTRRAATTRRPTTRRPTTTRRTPNPANRPPTLRRPVAPRTTAPRTTRNDQRRHGQATPTTRPQQRVAALPGYDVPPFARGSPAASMPAPQQQQQQTAAASGWRSYLPSFARGSPAASMPAPQQQQQTAPASGWRSYLPSFGRSATTQPPQMGGQFRVTAASAPSMLSRLNPFASAPAPSADQTPIQQQRPWLHRAASVLNPVNLVTAPVRNVWGAVSDTRAGRAVNGQQQGFFNNLMARQARSTNEVLSVTGPAFRRTTSIIDRGLGYIGQGARWGVEQVRGTDTGRAMLDWRRQVANDPRRLSMMGPAGALIAAPENFRAAGRALAPVVQSVQRWGRDIGERGVQNQMRLGIPEAEARQSMRDALDTAVGVPQLIPMVRGAGIGARMAISVADGALARQGLTQIARSAMASSAMAGTEGISSPVLARLAAPVARLNTGMAALESGSAAVRYGTRLNTALDNGGNARSLFSGRAAWQGSTTTPAPPQQQGGGWRSYLPWGGSSAQRPQPQPQLQPQPQPQPQPQQQGGGWRNYLPWGVRSVQRPQPQYVQPDAPQPTPWMAGAW